MQNNIIQIDVTVNLDEVLEAIKNADSLQDNEKMFEYLSKIQEVKNKFEQEQEKLENVEKDIKAAINDKAKALYGNDWSAIKGEKFKITRSYSGSVFEITEKTPEKFLIIKKSPNTKAIQAYMQEKNKLPAGVDYNPKRSEVIRITVKKDANSQN